MMVLAGPGSGKTFVLTRRIAHLINTHHVNPSEILVITFTRAAAGEMQQRFLSLCEGTHPPVTFGTFHAVFYSILKETSVCRSGSILSEAEKRKMLRDIIQRNHYNIHMNTDMLDEILTEIGQYKSLCFSRGDTSKERSVCESSLCFSRGDTSKKRSVCESNLCFSSGDTSKERSVCESNLCFSSGDTYHDINGNKNIDYIPRNIKPEVFQNIYRDFTEAQDILGKIDFDDMAFKCMELFSMRPDILRHYQARYRYILVDEFQDIAPVQYTLVRLLAKPFHNLFIVGDDDQSIYGFRGAKPDIMRNFPKDYPSAEILSLQVNYRSTPEIVQSAGRLISHNRNRFSKDSRAEHPSGAPVCVRGYETYGMMESALIRLLAQEKKAGSLSACAVISRTSGCFPLFAEKLRQAGISCSFKEKIKSVFDHEMVDDLLAYLEFSQMPVKSRSRGQFFRFMNRPLRYISREAVDEAVDFRHLITFYRGRPAMQETVLRLKQDLEKISNMPVFLAINYIRKAMGYDNYLREKYRSDPLLSKKDEAEDILRTVEIIQDSAKGCKTVQEWKEVVEERRADGKPDKMLLPAGIKDAAGKRQLYSETETKEAEIEQRVTFMTMHGSKGLEYDKVFIVNCNEGSIPHRKARSEEEIEEERRMFYVGMTRAKKELTLLYVNGEKETKKESGPARVMPPSRFLKEIQEIL